MINVNSGKKNYLIKRKLALSLGIVVFVGILWFVPSKNGFEVDVLDVGQGDGIYISSGDGSRFFIDGGSTTLDTREPGR